MVWPSAVAAATFACIAFGAGAQGSETTSEGPPATKTAVGSEMPLFIPAVAHVSGAAGTNWRSDVEIYNLGPGQAFIDVAVLEKDQPNPSPTTRAFVISPGMSYRYRDTLYRMFGESGSAALRIDAADDALVVTSRTFNETDSGTYGQFIGALAESRAIHTGEQGRIVQLSQHGSSDAGYRTNVGFLNCSDREISVAVDLFRGSGDQLGTRLYTLGPAMFKQIDRIFTTVTGDDVEDGFAVVSTSTAGGAFFAYGSVVDNRTGDPVYLPAAIVASEPVFIPATAHVSGAVGTDWRTDLELHNSGSVDAQFEVSMLETGQDNSTPVSSIEHVSAGAGVRLDDVLHSTFGFDGTAALRITPMAGAHGLVTSRTYNQTPGGTYGQFVGAVSASDAIAYSEQGLIVGLTHNRAAASGYRTNLGYLNCTGSEAVVRIDLYRSCGVLLGTIEDTLGPYMHRQQNRIFQQVTNDDVADGFAVVAGTTPGSRLIAYASVVDNATGDPIYVPATTIVARSSDPLMDPRATMHLLFRSLEVVAADLDVEDMITMLQMFGLQAALNQLAAFYPDIVSLGQHSFTLDYGSETRLHDGNLVSGRVEADFADIVINSTTISGQLTFTFDELQWNHQAPPVDTIVATVDLAVDPQGHVTGTTSFSGTGSVPVKSDPVTLGGEALWDTLLCDRFPVGGTITLEVGDELFTFTFTPVCDGTFSYLGPGDVDLSGYQRVTVRVLNLGLRLRSESPACSDIGPYTESFIWNAFNGSWEGSTYHDAWQEDFGGVVVSVDLVVAARPAAGTAGFTAWQQTVDSQDPNHAITTTLTITGHNLPLVFTGGGLREPAAGG